LFKRMLCVIIRLALTSDAKQWTVYNDTRNLKKAVLSQGEPRDATVNFYTYRIQ